MKQHFILAFVVLTIAACADSTTPNPVGGETHFLHACEGDTCGLGLECVCGVCTKPCTTDSTCKDQNPRASCEPAGTPNGACVNPQTSPVCDVECNESSDCNSLGSGFTCEQGSCRKVSAGACVYDGAIYANGDSFAVTCNTCECRDGSMICTRLACLDAGMDGNMGDNDAGNGLACVVGAITYPDGASDVPDSDTCNNCMCIDGVVDVCDEALCPLPQCHPLHAITWFSHGPFDRPDLTVRHDLARDGSFTRTNGLQETCRTPLPACGSDTIDAEDVNAALLHPDVVTALAAAPVTYGVPLQDGGGGFVIEGRTVSLDDTCMNDNCGVPAGVRALYRMLQTLETQQHCALDSECRLPMDGGVCLDAGMTRFYYDAASGTCREFLAHCGGGGGNANNFMTEAECLASCEGRMAVARPEAACQPGDDVPNPNLLAPWPNNDISDCAYVADLLATPNVERVGSSPSAVHAAAIDDQDVYLFRDGPTPLAPAVVRVPTDQSAPWSYPTNFGSAYTFAVDGCRIYWVNDGRVFSMLTGGSEPTLLAELPLFGGEILGVDGAHIFFWIGDMLYRVARGGGDPLIMTTRSDAPYTRHEHVLSNGWLYWIAGGEPNLETSVGRVLGMRTDRVEPPRVFAEGLSNPRALAVDADHLYVANAGTWTVGNVHNGNGSIVRIARDGSVAETLADNLGEPNSMVVLNGFAYWLEDPQANHSDVRQLRRCSTDGATATETVLATGGYARDLTSDEDFLYWVTECTSETRVSFLFRVPAPQ